MLEKLISSIAEWLNDVLSPDPSVEFMRLSYSSHGALKLYEQALSHGKEKLPFYRAGKWWIVTKVVTEDDYVIVKGVEVDLAIP